VNLNEAAAKEFLINRGWPSYISHENTTSWTSSILCAIRIAFTNVKYNSPEDIGFTVVDTLELAAHSFISLSALLEACKQCNTNSEGEVCSRNQDKHQDGLHYISMKSKEIGKGCSHTTNLEALMSHGIASILPEQTGPVSLRGDELLKKSPGLLWFQDGVSVSEAEFATAKSIAFDCFGNDWILPITVQLLSFKKRIVKDPIVLQACTADSYFGKLSNASIS
jgi:hypothetical protein